MRSSLLEISTGGGDEKVRGERSLKISSLFSRGTIICKEFTGGEGTEPVKEGRTTATNHSGLEGILF